MVDAADMIIPLLREMRAEIARGMRKSEAD